MRNKDSRRQGGREAGEYIRTSAKQAALRSFGRRGDVKMTKQRRCEFRLWSCSLLGRFGAAGKGAVGEDFESATETLLADFGGFGGEPAEELHASRNGEAVEFLFEARTGFQGGSELGGNRKFAGREIELERDADYFADVSVGGFAKRGIYLEARAASAAGDESGARAAMIRSCDDGDVFGQLLAGFLAAGCALASFCGGGIFFRESEANVFGDVDVAQHPDFVNGREELRRHGRAILPEILIEDARISTDFQKNASGET